MALSIVSNQAASIATRSLGQSNDAATATAEKLSSGKRINSAKDDAAGSAIAARLSAEVAGLQQAGVNAGQASSMLQIADGAFQNVEDILTRAKSLSVQAGSEQISDSERAFLDQEFQALKSEIDRIANDTEFNGTKLVNGDISAQAQIGAAAIANFAPTANGSADLNALSNTISAGAGLQGVGAMGVSLQDTISAAQLGGANDPTENFVGQTGLVNFTASNNRFTVELDVMTTGGSDANNVVFSGAVASVPEMNVTLMAVANNVQGTVTVSLGSGFNTAADDMFNIALNGVENKSFNFKVGTGTVGAEDEISVQIGGITESALGLSSSSIDTKENADTASELVSNAIDTLQAKRSDVGAAQNRLDFAAQNVELTRENQEAARSELEDLNVAKAITEFSQQQLLVQAGTSTLSQANQLPQNLLQLFR